MNETVMEMIRSHSVQKKSVALWWLGQNGYIFKSAEGTLVAVDVYLSDSCERAYPTVNLRRRVPVLIAPERLQVDVFACTHSHWDHLDPDTVSGLRNKETVAFVGSGECLAGFRGAGVEDSRIHVVWPRAVFEYKDLRLTATFALPTDATDLNHIGFLVQFGSGPKVYITGDTDHHPLLYSAAEHNPDVMITCINGGFNNLSHWEAADVASKIKPKIAIPCHYDMFVDNSVDPHQFEVSLKQLAAETTYCELRHSEPFVFSR